MKISIIGSYPDPRLIKESNALSKMGHNVSLTLWDRGLVFSQNETNFNIRKFKLKNASFGDFSTIIYFPFWWAFSLYSLFKDKQDVIHAINFDNLWIALIVAKIKRKKLVYEIFDFYGDTVTFPIFNHFARNLIKRMDKFAMNFVDTIIIADNSRIEQIGPQKKEVITINNSPKDMLKKDLTSKKNDKFTIFYGGQVEYNRCIDKVILAVKDIPDVNLIMMGHCSSLDYKNKILKLGKNVKNFKFYLEAVPHAKIIEETLKSDLIIACYDPSIPNNRYASPNKLFEAMMCGKPIIVNKETSMASIVEKENCGITVPYADVEAIKSAIILLKDNKELYEKLKKNARKAYETKYSWSLMESRLNTLYNKFKRN